MDSKDSTVIDFQEQNAQLICLQSASFNQLFVTREWHLIFGPCAFYVVVMAWNAIPNTAIDQCVHSTSTYSTLDALQLCAI